MATTATTMAAIATTMATTTANTVPTKPRPPTIYAEYWSFKLEKAGAASSLTGSAYAEISEDCERVVKEISVKLYGKMHTTIQLNTIKVYAGKATFLIDTGAEINLIREDILEARVEIDESRKTRLHGITSEAVITLGKVELDIEKRKTKFDVVGDQFNLEADGILGLTFLEDHGVKINFEDRKITFGNNTFDFCKDTIEIPERSIQMVHIRVVNAGEEGYGKQRKKKITEELKSETLNITEEEEFLEDEFKKELTRMEKGVITRQCGERITLRDVRNASTEQMRTYNRQKKFEEILNNETNIQGDFRIEIDGKIRLATGRKKVEKLVKKELEKIMFLRHLQDHQLDEIVGYLGIGDLVQIANPRRKTTTEALGYKKLRKMLLT
ncbi:hypothetical protein KQX54_012055 [Cotesia glomerata]|uniref:Peptidase A2 domain-containing protein n=1 Tax=Cotesia glomerata TaxID=32391 RepID=A0AAV7I712_COTGL|nr:hypothetical protein KQX54_012055 [Cotesia glomerata]